MEPILEVCRLAKIFGDGCPFCHKSTGPAYETNICTYCGSVAACSNVSFKLYSGEVLGIVGESGSGKSTLIRLLHFDWEATDGSMYMYINGQGSGEGQNNVSACFSGNGQNIDLNKTAGINLLTLSPFRKRQIRNSLMGIVYQNPYMGLRMEISSGGNVAERLIVAGWRNVERMRNRTSIFLQKTEMPVERMDEPPKNFSGGMQQRIQIAKALSNNPMILLLDEITTGLDLSVQARVLDLVKSLHRELHVSIIVVSHDLGVIRLLTTRTMVMKCGKIVESGLTDQILEDPQHPYTQLLVSSQL